MDLACHDALLRIDPADGRSYELLQRMIDAVPDPIFLKDREHRWVAFNAAFERLLGRTRAEMLGRSDPDFTRPELVAEYWAMDDRVFASGEANENEELVVDAAGVEHTSWTRKFPVRDPSGAVVGLCAMITDITSLKRRLREAERIERENQEQRAVIAAQAAMLDALTMPVVEVGAGVLLVPLVGELSEGRVERAIEELLASIGRARARVVLFDLTGVPAVDAAIARDLLRAVQAARLLGCRGVLCGIGPTTAGALVELGVEFAGLVTRGTLRDGLDYAARLLGERR